MARPRVLVTGFGPFPGIAENPSAWLAETLAAEPPMLDAELHTRVLPTAWQAAELMPRLYAQPFYRLQWSHYTENSDRNDMYNTIGVGLVYMFNDWASIRTFITYENRNSTDDTVSDYNKWDAGGGVTFSAKF